MKINVDAKLKDRKDRPIAEAGVELTFGDVVAVAFENPPPVDAQNMARKEKLRRAAIAEAIAKGGEQDFKEAEIDEIRTVTSHFPIPIVRAIEKVIESAA